MKSANEPAFTKPFLVVDQSIAAMHANVVKGPDFPVLTAHQQYGRVGNREVPDHVTAGLRKVFLPPHVEPSPPENAVAFEFKKLRRRAGFSRYRPRAKVRMLFYPAPVGHHCSHGRASSSLQSQEMQCQETPPCPPVVSTHYRREDATCKRRRLGGICSNGPTALSESSPAIEEPLSRAIEAETFLADL